MRRTIFAVALAAAAVIFGAAACQSSRTATPAPRSSETTTPEPALHYTSPAAQWLAGFCLLTEQTSEELLKDEPWPSSGDPGVKAFIVLLAEHDTIMKSPACTDFWHATGIFAGLLTPTP